MEILEQDIEQLNEQKISVEEEIIKDEDSSPEQIISIEKLLAEIGLDESKFNERIIPRLELLRDATGLLQEAQNTLDDARKVFTYFQETGKSLTPEEMRRIIQAIPLADIGKTGPVDATKEQQTLITKLYAIRNIGVGFKTSVADIIQNNAKEFGNNEEAIECFRSLGLSPEMSMGAFWRLHVQWTLDIIKNDGIPADTVATAAMHHAVEGDNPDLILNPDGTYKEPFGENTEFNREEKLVIILDKYRAFLDRMQLAHHVAIRRIYEMLEVSRFANDKEFFQLLEDVSKALEPKEARET
ncbi:MAG: hypothetical protein Q8Q39_05650 [bacterium]|nr:hypothetical protein [bacterium]